MILGVRSCKNAPRGIRPMAPGTHSTHFHSQAEPYTRRGPEAGEASGFGARYTDGHPQSQWPTTEAPLACSRSAGAPSKSPASSRSRTLRSPVSSGRAPPAIRTVCRPWHRTHLGRIGRGRDGSPALPRVTDCRSLDRGLRGPLGPGYGGRQVRKLSGLGRLPGPGCCTSTAPALLALDGKPAQRGRAPTVVT